MTKTHVSKQRGNAPGFWFFRLFLRMGGLHAAYFLLYGVALHYWLFDGEAVKSAAAYLRRRFPESGPLMIRMKCYRLFVSQGKQLIDRMAAFSGAAAFNFRLRGKENVEALAHREEGFVLLTAHAGNWQIALTTLSRFNKKVFLVMNPEHNEAVKASLGISGDGGFIDTIPPGGSPGDVVRIINLLKQGHIVSFMGDRTYEAVSGEVSFLGERAAFPLGAFAVAAAAKVPVAVLLASRRGYRSYDVDLTHILKPTYKRKESKKEQLIGWAQAYADILADFFDQEPYQCFLFYDVWNVSEKNRQSAGISGHLTT